jgi:hypothetical protein
MVSKQITLLDWASTLLVLQDEMGNSQRQSVSFPAEGGGA